MTYPALVDGIAQHLHDAGVGTWRPDGSPYQPGEIPIMRRAFSPDPDVQLAVATYPAQTDDVLADDLVGVQVRIRGTNDPTTVDAIDTAVFGALHGLWHVQLGAVPVSQLLHQSGTSLGRDDNGRWEQVSNFHALVNRPR